MEKWQSWREGGRGSTELIYIKESLDQKRCTGGGGGRRMQRAFGRGKILAGGKVMNSFLDRLFYLFES